MENTILTFKDKDSISVNEFINFVRCCSEMESLKTQDLFRELITKINVSEIEYGSVKDVLREVVNILTFFENRISDGTVYKYLCDVEYWMYKNKDKITLDGEPVYITEMLLSTCNMNILRIHLIYRGFSNTTEYNNFCKFCIKNRLHESLSVLTYVALTWVFDSNQLKIRYD